MGISKLTDKRTKIRPKTNHSKRARLILSVYHICFVFFFLISYYVANVIGCSWFHDLPIRYHSLFYDLEAPPYRGLVYADLVHSRESSAKFVKERSQTVYAQIDHAKTASVMISQHNLEGKKKGEHQ